MEASKKWIEMYLFNVKVTLRLMLITGKFSLDAISGAELYPDAVI